MMRKKPKDSSSLVMPSGKGKFEVRLQALNSMEEFVLNYIQSPHSKGSLTLLNRNHHLRTKTNIGLARLDLGGHPHRNPDGTEVGRSHLHIFKEGSNTLPWAIDVPPDKFSNLDNVPQALADFMDYCRIEQKPNLIPRLLP